MPPESAMGIVTGITRHPGRSLLVLSDWPSGGHEVSGPTPVTPASSEVPTMRLLSSTCIILFLTAIGTPAQVLLQSGTVAHSGSSSQENVVRDGNGTLWCLSMTDNGADRPLLLQSSTDNGASWSNDPFVFNDASSGMSGTQLVNTCGLAVDDLGTLHATWGVYLSSPTYRHQYYRQYDPATTTASAIIDITLHVGASPSTPASPTSIAVDQAGTVWMTCHGTGSYAEALAYSNLPYASDLTFTRTSNITSSYSSQYVHMAIDANGYIHCTYYRNIAPGRYEHRYYDPATSTWSAESVLGNTTPTNDYYGDLCADSLGNVHCVYVMDAGTNSTWLFRYKKWDLTNGWGPEVILMDVPLATYNGIANYRISAIACDEATGTTRVVYRDLPNGGALEMVELPLNGAAFTPATTLGPPDLGAHVYYLPTLRGTLYPVSNNTAGNWDVTWQYRPTPGAPPYELWFQRVSSGPTVSISLTGPPTTGTNVGILMTSSADGGKPYVCALSFGNTPGLTLPDTRVIPLNWDFLFDLSLIPNPFIINNLGLLDGSGNGQATLFIPNEPLLVNFTIYAAFVTADGSAPSGIANISSALPITFQ